MQIQNKTFCAKPFQRKGMYSLLILLFTFCQFGANAQFNSAFRYLNLQQVGSFEWEVGAFNDKLTFSNNSTGSFQDQLVITKGGNVGIGTYNPSFKLHVAGPIFSEKYVVQNGQDGGSSRGIFMWGANDTNWGMYMGTSGAGKALDGGAAVAGHNFNSYSIRFRVFNGNSNGFIWENSSNQSLMSLNGSSGDMKLKGSLDVGGLTINGQAIGGGGQQVNYDLKAGNGNGFRFWNGDNSYKISMSNESHYKYGPVTDYSIKNNMSNNAGRGWTWGVNGQVPVAALNVAGEMQLAKSLAIGGNLIPNTVLTVDGRVYISEEGGSEAGFDNPSGSKYNDFLLWVEEGIVSTDFAVAPLNDWPDYVFGEDYDLPSLTEVEAHIKKNGHLHTIPGADEVREDGFAVKDMTKRMVQTIEELTLHTINQEKQINKLIARLEALEIQNK